MADLNASQVVAKETSAAFNTAMGGRPADDLPDVRGEQTTTWDTPRAWSAALSPRSCDTHD
jgi:hypothetical protein